ncbi:hypothetical protein DAPK24_027190 [Pichia kluyveri]|uniref:Uncharacterized protein n=1 Tax=Pichia kluyveri TaxID=36015 RepID=A0AAV5R699_PICKL|nr:hypothetical protein DAPK24_027190 [Pichia kluyveri]
MNMNNMGNLNTMNGMSNLGNMGNMGTTNNNIGGFSNNNFNLNLNSFTGINNIMDPLNLPNIGEIETDLSKISLSEKSPLISSPTSAL